jgi:hypothetical protein
MDTLQAEHHPSNSNSMSSSTKMQGDKATRRGIGSNGDNEGDNDGGGGEEEKQEKRNKFLVGPLKASKYIQTAS